jgi:hypothetical protein
VAYLFLVRARIFLSMAVPRPPDEVIDELLAETERRYLEFTKLLLGLGTGTLSLLLAFEQQYVRPQLGFRWLVLGSWWSLAFCVFTGLLLQWYLAADPARRLKRKTKIPATLADGREVLIGHISGEPTWVERILFWSHLLSLLAGLGFLLAYKLAIAR